MQISTSPLSFSAYFLQVKMDSPKPFIVTDNDNKLTVNEEVVELLSTVEEPIVIVSIVGYYRTGKSYLLNRLIGRKDGFPLGATVQSKTKGIWIWFSDHPKRPKTKLLLLDTEGLSDPEKADRNHDIWIFSLAILLSSTFVFNSTGTIDNNSLNDLYMTSELTEHLKVKAEGVEEGTEFDRVFPVFIWAVRDFFLKQEIDGKTVSANEYLERCLALKLGNNKSTANANNIKRCVRAFFSERHCFLFPCPASKKEKLQNLEKLTESELEREFVNVIDRFTTFIFQKAPEKQVGDKVVNGNIFINLSKCYVDAIKDGRTPCIESTIKYIATAENERAKDESLVIYDREMGSLDLPATEEDVSNKHQSAQKKAMDSFLSKSMFDEDQKYQIALVKSLQENFEKFVAKNEESSISKCKDILSNLYEGIEQQFNDDPFVQSGTYSSYMEQMKKLERDYSETPRKGVKADAVFSDFMQEKEGERKRILQFDKELEIKEKEIEEQRLKAEREHQLKETREKEIASLKYQMEQREKYYKNLMRQYKEDLDRRTEAQIKLLQKTMEKQTLEVIRLVGEDFKEEAELLRCLVENVKKEMIEKRKQADQMNRTFQMEITKKIEEMMEADKQKMNTLLVMLENSQPKHKKSRCLLM